VDLATNACDMPVICEHAAFSGVYQRTVPGPKVASAPRALQPAVQPWVVWLWRHVRASIGPRCKAMLCKLYLDPVTNLLCALSRLTVDMGSYDAAVTMLVRSVHDAAMCCGYAAAGLVSIGICNRMLSCPCRSPCKTITISGTLPSV
jgi:hypothetical protein